MDKFSINLLACELMEARQILVKLLILHYSILVRYPMARNLATIQVAFIIYLCMQSIILFPICHVWFLQGLLALFLMMMTILFFNAQPYFNFLNVAKDLFRSFVYSVLLIIINYYFLIFCSIYLFVFHSNFNFSFYYSYVFFYFFTFFYCLFCALYFFIVQIRNLFFDAYALILISFNFSPNVYFAIVTCAFNLKTNLINFQTFIWKMTFSSFSFTFLSSYLVF